ncbi:MAG: IS66 family insertion sequence element accessory protein TnpB [Alphaproteobacteria bacterium]|jgi:transposase|nr:IS66 family insertion sequence element accessory protein TnpB [Alphaproteobacteria bacterium]|tara:strand:+ start:98 stop:451 length:354 start_codon:yes stop_codon:yes gene_type:complete
MIVPGNGVRILVAAQPVDFRKGIDGLAAVVQEVLALDPFAGDLFVFRPKRADRVKILTWDGTGMTLYHKRLEEGRFRWPPPVDGVVKLSAAELSMLLEGLDWGRFWKRRPRTPQVAG